MATDIDHALHGIMGAVADIQVNDEQVSSPMSELTYSGRFAVWFPLWSIASLRRKPQEKA